MSTVKKYAVIEGYLRKNFPDSKIEQKHDFDCRAQLYRIDISDSSLLLKIGGEFAEDNSIEEIIRLFDLWALADILAKETKLGVLVTQRGLETFRRSK